MSVFDFFATLSERFSKENDLSDVTYTCVWHQISLKNVLSISSFQM